MSPEQERLLLILGELQQQVRGQPPLLTDDSVPAPRGATCQAHSRVHIVCDGSMHMRSCVDGAVVPIQLQPGTCMHTAPHGWTHVDWSHAHKTFGIVFHRSFVRYLYFEHNGKFNRNRKRSGPDCFFHTTAPLPLDGVRLIQVIDEIARRKHRRVCTQIALKDALMSMVYDELEREAENIDPSRLLWQEIVDYLGEHAHQNIDRNSIARVFQMHPNSLSRLFLRYGNESFQELLLRYRLERSRSLLHHLDCSIEEVAVRSGFANANYFIKVFRVHFGETPGATRSNLLH